MLQPRPSTVRDPAAAPPAEKPVSTGTRPDRQLGDRVRSLSLARLPERQYTLWTNLAWVAGLAAIGFGIWYYFSGSHAATPDVDQSVARATTAKTEVKSPVSGTAGQRSAESTSTLRATPSTPSAAANKRDVVLEAKGYIIPAHQILVSPKVTGMIVQFNVEEGRHFNKGDVLAVLESTDYAADLRRAEAMSA